MKKYAMIFPVCLILSVHLYAQSPELIWDKTYGLPDDFNQTLDCSPDYTGSLFVVGYTKSWPHGDFLIIKYNTSNGDITWSKSFNGNPGDTDNDNDIAMGCQVDGSGNLFVTGMSSNSAGNLDVLTVKYNGSTGDTLWTRRFSGEANGYDAGTKCALDAAGNLYVTGLTFTGTYTDFCILKYNAANGDFIWSRNYPSPLGNKGEAYESSLIGSDIYINGYIYSGTTYKLYTVKCNTLDGDTIWTRVNEEGLDSLQYINSACVANNSGDVFIAGNCSNATQGIYGRIIKYDASGNVVWSKIFENAPNDPLNDVLYGCTLDLTGNLIVTGTTNGTSTFLNNLITLRYDAFTGDTIWTKTYNGRGGTACAVDAQGYLYITGAPKTWQGLTLKYDNYGMDGISKINRNFIENLYPNPARDFISLDLNIENSSEIALNLFNLKGELVRKDILRPGQRVIYVNDLKSGSYILEIVSKGKVEYQKLIIQ